jgi:hypothetical protein
MNLLPRPHVVWILTVLAVTVSLSILLRSGAQRRSNSINSKSNKEIVVSVEIVAENRTIQQYTYREQEAYYSDLPTWLDRYSFLPAPNEVPDDQRVCLVHVGELVEFSVLAALLKEFVALSRKTTHSKQLLNNN